MPECVDPPTDRDADRDGKHIRLRTGPLGRTGRSPPGRRTLSRRAKTAGRPEIRHVPPPPVRQTDVHGIVFDGVRGVIIRKARGCHRNLTGVRRDQAKGGHPGILRAVPAGFLDTAMMPAQRPFKTTATSKPRMPPQPGRKTVRSRRRGADLTGAGRMQRT